MSSEVNYNFNRLNSPVNVLVETDLKIHFDVKYKCNCCTSLQSDT